ncbi:MAG TPA: ABC transporter ATP-binding protein, partial [Spirochaetota bacterium]|nr:ABC transporter ATP-binding protein [Spirochaetota bacterium]
LDEPTTGLDYPSLAELMGIVSTLHRAGITILMITHSMETAAAYGSTILSMNEGRVLFYGNKREFFSNDALIEAARIKRTDIMDLSMRLNGRMLMDAEEFRACWKRKR